MNSGAIRQGRNIEMQGVDATPLRNDPIRRQIYDALTKWHATDSATGAYLLGDPEVSATKTMLDRLGCDYKLNKAPLMTLGSWRLEDQGKGSAVSPDGWVRGYIEGSGARKAEKYLVQFNIFADPIVVTDRAGGSDANREPSMLEAIQEMAKRFPDAIGRYYASPAAVYGGMNEILARFPVPFDLEKVVVPGSLAKLVNAKGAAEVAELRAQGQVVPDFDPKTDRQAIAFLTQAEVWEQFKGTTLGQKLSSGKREDGIETASFQVIGADGRAIQGLTMEFEKHGDVWLVAP